MLADLVKKNGDKNQRLWYHKELMWPNGILRWKRAKECHSINLHSALEWLWTFNWGFSLRLWVLCIALTSHKVMVVSFSHFGSCDLYTFWLILKYRNRNIINLALLMTWKCWMEYYYVTLKQKLLLKKKTWFGIVYVLETN